MVRPLLLALCIVSAIGCDDVPPRSAKEWPSQQTDLTGIEGLEGCRLFFVRTPGSMPNLWIVRCPNRSASITWKEQQGKHSVIRQTTTEP